jgi:hypothetical protein
VCDLGRLLRLLTLRFQAAAKVDPRERLRQAVQAAGGFCERFDATPVSEHLESGGESGTESESLPRGSTSLPLGSAPRG